MYYLYCLKIKSPPNSPDLNPIEWLWADMKKTLSKKAYNKAYNSEQELAQAIEEYSTLLTAEKCQNYINKLHEVMFS